MEKTYGEFMDDITSEELYEGLLAYGFFVEKLPPVFTAVPFFNYCISRSSPFEKGWSDYIIFSTMRNVGVPRIMGIPNPFKYQRLCLRLSENWGDIREHFHRQTDGQDYRVSRIHIRKEYGKNCIFRMNYKNWRVDGNPELDLLFQENGPCRYLVKADVSSCFPSIYTHSIPWALVGKTEAKATINSDIWYNEIDWACSAMRNGETHGLLIGPHASNLLAEIIMTAVDKNLYDKGYRYVRHIDDYDCYVRTQNDAQLFLRDLERALQEFDLPLNHKKTKIIELPVGIEKSWKHQLSDLPRVGTSGMVEYPQVNTFIDTSLHLATATGDFAIINYAIKKLSGLVLSERAKGLAATRFMHMAAIYPYLLPLMEDFVFTPYKVDTKKIEVFSNAIYQSAEQLNDYESMCSAIYFAIRFSFPLSEFETNYDHAVQYVIDSNDCILLTMTWLYFMKENHGNRCASHIKPLRDKARSLKDTDMDRYWLFCYEVLTKGNLKGEWRTMKEAGISFIRKEIIDSFT